MRRAEVRDFLLAGFSSAAISASRFTSMARGFSLQRS
jgi:hypothetical protein